MPSERPERPIEIRVGSVSQLFQTLDPYPFGEKDLDRDAEDYIVSWARELPRHAPITIIVHLPAAEVEGERARGLPDAMHGYFEERAAAVSRDINELLRIGRTALLVGMTILAACLVLAQLSSDYLGEGTLQSLARESFLILGWVANWRPLEIFLYEWWPLARTRNLYRRLSSATVIAAATPERGR